MWGVVRCLDSLSFLTRLTGANGSLFELSLTNYRSNLGPRLCDFACSVLLVGRRLPAQSCGLAACQSSRIPSLVPGGCGESPQTGTGPARASQIRGPTSASSATFRRSLEHASALQPAVSERSRRRFCCRGHFSPRLIPECYIKSRAQSPQTHNTLIVESLMSVTKLVNV